MFSYTFCYFFASSKTENFTQNNVTCGCKISPCVGWKKKADKVVLPGDNGCISMHVSELFEQYTQAVNIVVDDVNELFPPDHILRFKFEILKCFHCYHIRQYNNKSYIQGILFTKSFHMYDLIDRTWRSTHGNRGKGWKGECSATQSVAQRPQLRDYLDTLVKGPTTGPNSSQKGSRI